MENNEKKLSMWNSEYLRVFANISAWIIGPVLASLFIGKYLDNRFHTAPWILGIALAISFTVSMVAIVKIAAKYSKEIDKNDGENK